LGPLQHLPDPPADQAAGALCSGRSPRRRRCLLKGCEQFFQPDHPLSRYCSASCVLAARRWSRWSAARRYRRTEQGRHCRRQQSRRYRQRRLRRQPASGEEPPACEGHHQELAAKKSSCLRPGCYVLFSLQPRSPGQRFCGPLCRQALRRVQVREGRWQQREGRWGGPRSMALERGP
jgi:hypothetical protein